MPLRVLRWVWVFRVSLCTFWWDVSLLLLLVPYDRMVLSCFSLFLTMGVGLCCFSLSLAGVSLSLSLLFLSVSDCGGGSLLPLSVPYGRSFLFLSVSCGGRVSLAPFCVLRCVCVCVWGLSCVFVSCGGGGSLLLSLYIAMGVGLSCFSFPCVLLLCVLRWGWVSFVSLRGLRLGWVSLASLCFAVWG